MTKNEVRDRLQLGQDPLELSVVKWEAIVAYLETISSKKTTNDIITRLWELDQGKQNCALCHIYYEVKDEDEPEGRRDCPECPVAQTTSWGRCVKTPYSIWIDNLLQGRASIKNLIGHAKEELEFLKLLRPLS